MRDTLQLMKILTLTDGFNDSWVKHGLSDDVTVLRSCVATLPLSSLQILVSCYLGEETFVEISCSRDSHKVLLGL